MIHSFHFFSFKSSLAIVLRCAICRISTNTIPTSRDQTTTLRHSIPGTDNSWKLRAVPPTLQNTRPLRANICHNFRSTVHKAKCDCDKTRMRSPYKSTTVQQSRQPNTWSGIVSHAIAVYLPTNAGVSIHLLNKRQIFDCGSSVIVRNPLNAAYSIAFVTCAHQAHCIEPNTLSLMDSARHESRVHLHQRNWE